MMSTSPFKNLPPELVCKIVFNLPYISDVIHLGKTSRINNEIWTNNARLICSVVMSRSILCFQGAEPLLEVQENRTEARDHDLFRDWTSEAAVVLSIFVRTLQSSLWLVIPSK